MTLQPKAPGGADYRKKHNDLNDNGNNGDNNNRERKTDGVREVVDRAAGVYGGGFFGSMTSADFDAAPPSRGPAPPCIFASVCARACVQVCLRCGGGGGRRHAAVDG